MRTYCKNDAQLISLQYAQARRDANAGGRIAQILDTKLTLGERLQFKVIDTAGCGMPVK